MDIAVLGASGLVGQRMLAILAQYDCKLYAVGQTSSGSLLKGEYGSFEVEHYQKFDFGKVDGVVMSVGSTGARWVKNHVSHAWIVDNSSTFRRDQDWNLVVPEIYQGHVGRYVASPNCVAIPVALVLFQLQSFGVIEEVWGSTYQSASGAGREYLAKLNRQEGIYDTVMPKIGEMTDGISDEEEKVTYEVKKILGLECDVMIMCVRVPIQYGHSVHLRVRMDRKLDLDKVLEKFKECPYIEYSGEIIDPKSVVGCHKVHVGRVRRVGQCIDMWIVSDNLYRGAAWNVCEIAKRFFGVKEVMHCE